MAAASFAAVQVQAQTNYEWTGGTSGDWDVNANWSPAVPSGQIIGSGSSVNTIYDRVTISGASVSRSGNVYFRTQSTGDSRKGTFNAITLQNNATLSISGELRITTSSSNFIRNVRVENGSTLNAGTIATGTQNNTADYSTWSIQGAVIAENFIGYQGNNDSNANAGGRGYILNVDGGSLAVSDTFNWTLYAGTGGVLRGEINISNNGMVNIGTMSSNWRGSEGNFVNFVDGSGSLKFGYDNWDLDAVEGLITSSYIRKDAAVGGIFNVENVGDGWLVTVNAIPEASTTVALFSAVALGAVCLAKHRRKRTQA